ncbi:mitochondrial ribosomal protein [Metschnikowia bicuspidata var. bicuspidata NRRL YB-4993]|uniref:Mitochondrial ribosomal protein n=1 Tax=Metschnikowia bicuspidata var. bicuspidata NRRL YB-4993 TaxID=869754 RepID=A0A1A0HJH8_9ASCO|nr:mitochondrial ribosomal protein [Metschnikowia bicuspidata var. bicuspidata NRRL YB-4993]OBA24042.1 mitochondrial ribosomal protein [Metschnikowia bicuspidata var. bicuspidata NRRL YB-4993]
MPLRPLHLTRALLGTCTPRRSLQHLAPAAAGEESRGPETARAQPQLPFDRRKNGEKFGQLVRDEHWRPAGAAADGRHVKSVALAGEKPAYLEAPSPFRKADGSFVHGRNSEEARLDPRTLGARVDSLVTQLPAELAGVIGRNILLAVLPAKLRERAAQIYQSLEKEQIQRAPELALDADAHIAALFLQNYSHAYRALSELKQRVGPHFHPDLVLDIGYGPATGMLALNELMGAGFAPRTKEAYVVGRSNREMKKRAKILLSRQVSEIPRGGPGETESQETESRETEPKETEPKETEPKETNDAGAHYIGQVDASQITVVTRLRDALPSTKQYALIIVNQALLSREYNFPKDVDTNLHMILRLLKPDGHLVIVERGNALGFEIVARARQVMLRPESHRGEVGRVPRPYIRGSSVKPQKLRKEDQLITEDHIQYEHALLQQMENGDAAGAAPVGLEAQINAKFGPVSDEDMRFEFEDTGDYDVVPPQGNGPPDVDFHLSVVAPCAHHAVCPLQLGDPKFYKISGHQHRLQFCSFQQVVERPRYTMELKRGKRLATLWNKDAEDGFGLKHMPKSTAKLLQGSGRPGGNNSESGSFSYLIMHRAKNGPDDLRAIRDARDHQHEDPCALPRILETPEKVKKNVRLKVCAPSGNIELWQVPRSVGKQDYHDARKARQGDLWALGKKSALVKSRLSDAHMDKLKRMLNLQRKFVVKEKRKQQTKKLTSRLEADFDDPLDDLDSLASELEQSRKYRAKGKKAGFDVDLRAYDGK